MKAVFTCIVLALLQTLLIGATYAQSNEKSNVLYTAWGQEMGVKDISTEYPRPNMERKEWKSLNGYWNLELLAADDKVLYRGMIRVPFPLESQLSGVGRKLAEKQSLVYTRSFEVPDNWQGNELLLHFEAVDYRAEVYVNGQFAGAHEGGYDPFSFEISKYLQEGELQQLKVHVYDPTDMGRQSRGKQVLNPEGIYYTSVSGIWQTVWLEPVSPTRIVHYKVTPDIDAKKIVLEMEMQNTGSQTQLALGITFKGKAVFNYQAEVREKMEITIDDMHLWSPEQPDLYDIEIYLLENGKQVDHVSAYFGMRKVSLSNEEQPRILLNNTFLFQNGVLDQGYWPDGIYTAPSDEALKNDILLAKQLGFNMLRKHVKIEPRRFYYWCDVLGMLVWQDMPSGDTKIGVVDKDIDKDPKAARQFEYELQEMIRTLYNHPSIVMWIPFNEGWGQYNTSEIVDLVKQSDPGRLVSNASGWVDRGLGDIYDIHPYPEPQLPQAQKDRAIVIGEFGGISLILPGHMWSEEAWGYSVFTDTNRFIETYEAYYNHVWQMVDEHNLSAVVYTQLTDVETESNGLFTYDRKKCKLSTKQFHAINTRNYLPKPILQPQHGLANKGDSVWLDYSYKGDIYLTLDGKEPTRNDVKYTKAIVLEANTVIKAKVFNKDLESRTDRINYTLTTTPRPRYLYPYQKYTAGGDFALIDGKKGSTRFDDGNWQGFRGNHAEVSIDISAYKTKKKVELSFLEDTKSWIFLPTEVSLYVSEDGKNFTLLESKTCEQSTQHGAPKIASYTFKLEKEYPFIKVRAKNRATCPAWHEGSGKESWIFMDEVVIK